MTRLSQRLASLSPEQRALVERRLLAQRRGAQQEEPPIPRREDAAPCPLSFAQQRLWFLEQLDPGSPVHNIPFALHLQGALDVEALRRALEAVVARHEMLRTTFATLDGSPVQIVGEAREFQLPVVDLIPDHNSRHRDEQEAAVWALLEEEARRPFDLRHDLMLRARLLRLAPEEHLLVLVLHHIASDGWSAGVLRRELGLLYQAFAQGKPSPLPELPIQYADFALWQRAHLQGETLDRQLSYWKQQLAGLVPALELPSDRPRPPSHSFKGDSRSLTLPHPLLQQLKSLSQQERSTLFMTLLAAFATLLHRYTGQQELVVGSPIAGRTRTQTEALIGFFVNTLALRANLEGNPSFRQLLAQLREVALGAFANQELPFDKLVEELHPDRSLSHTPLFRVMFILQNAPMQDTPWPGLSFDPVELHSGASKFDLTLSMMELPQGLRASVEYNAGLFDAATIDRMLGHLQTLLEGVVADPDRTISDLPLLKEEERHRLLVEWNDTKRDYPRELCVHQLFERQVERTPDAVAILFEGERLTYRELNRRANRLAHRLIAMGVGPDTLVGLRVERSPEMVVGMLGILKAGGAYLPLDPSYPPERIAFMLEDSRAPVVLTGPDIAEMARRGRPNPDSAAIAEPGRDAALARATALPPLDVTEPALSLTPAVAPPDEDPPNRATAENLAYVVYTSGSTGKPKGVAVPHRAVNRLVVNADYVRLNPSDVVAQLSNASFDAATFELWGALLSGARLVVIRKELAISPLELSAQIARHGVTALFLTTAWFNLMVREAPAAFRSVRHLLFGGEAADPRWVRELLKTAPPERLLHVYGPTETTTFATWHPVEEVPQGTTTVPIGRPIANTRAYLLDPRLNPVPVGVPGELYLGGDGVARGYLHQPELTAERFVPDPFGREPGARLYRTGDVARHLPDGSIEFLGRRDQQVKIRGFRIELGEIEAALDRHPAVRQAVVVAREDSGEKRLVAYLVPTGDGPPPVSELRGFLEERLPEYMVPSAFVPLETLPLNPNGKLDRAALPVPEQQLPREAAFVEPGDEVERGLAGIWEGLLGVRAVGATDDFFQLGGHSLLAVRLFSEIESRFGKRLPLATLFERATVRDLASLLRGEAESATPSSLVAIQPLGSRPPFFCLHGVDGEVFKYRELGRLLAPDQPVYGIRAPDLGRPSDRSIEEMAAGYLQEIRALQPLGPYYLGGYSAGGVWAFEVARRLRALGEEVALLALFDSWCPRYRRLLPLGQRLRRHIARVRLLRRREKPLALLGLLATAARSLPRPGRAEASPTTIRRPHPGSAGASPATVPSGGPWGATQPYWGAFTRYLPGPYPGRVTIFWTTDITLEVDPDVEPRLGWAELAGGGVEVERLPGPHLKMMSAPYVETLAERLRRHLFKAQGEP